MKLINVKISLIMLMLVFKLSEPDKIAGRAVKTCKKFEFSIDILSP